MSVTSETVVTFGSNDVQNRLVAIRTALASGAIGHWVHLTTGRHRGWLTREQPEGYDVTPISCRQFAMRIGQVADDIRNGVTYAVQDGLRREVAFYVCWCPPEELVRSRAVLSYTTRARRGTLARELWNQFASATAVQAEQVRVDA